MIVSLNWLSDWLDWKETNHEAIANALTLSTAEVEKIDVQGTLLQHCCIGQVVKISQHPNADRLRVCEVNTDKGTKTVVCGGTNLREGMLVAFAHVGGTVRHGTETITLQPIKIRGVESSGMICAAEELDLQGLFPTSKEDGERPVIDLARHPWSDMPAPGTDLREALGLTDTLLHVSNTAITMRPDLFSQRGFARECVAIGLASWKNPRAPFAAEKRAKITFPKKSLPFRLIVEDERLMPRYCGCLLTINDTGTTPEWMKQRLRAVGWRPISLPIDITNYVASEVGVPLHSFDADDFLGDIHMRASRKGETIVTLDGVTRTLPDGAPILCDDGGIFDLLGIMGGLRSSTKSTTRHIYLHSASILPAAIRKTILATGHRTDAATVYEKGVPHITTEQGFERALELFLALAQGATIVSVRESYGTNDKAPSIALDLARMNSLLGITITDKKATQILSSLGCSVKKAAKKKIPTLLVTPPLHRLRDLREPCDIIEEVGRIGGYASIPEIMPSARLQIPARDMRLHRLRSALVERTFLELTPLSFASEGQLRLCKIDPADAVQIANPLGEETAFLQTSMLTGLLTHAEQHMAQRSSALQTFSAGHVFSKTGGEHAQMGAMIAMPKEAPLIRSPLLMLKDDLVSALQCIDIAVECLAARNPPAFAHPGRTADLLVRGESIGTLCEIHPSITRRAGIGGRVAVALIRLDTLFSITPQKQVFSPTPAFPEIRYDITLPRSHAETTAPILAMLRVRSPLLRDVSIVDLYEQSASAQQYTVTLRLTYRADDRTLTEDEAKREHEKVIEGIRHS